MSIYQQFLNLGASPYRYDSAMRALDDLAGYLNAPITPLVSNQGIPSLSVVGPTGLKARIYWVSFPSTGAFRGYCRITNRQTLSIKHSSLPAFLTRLSDVTGIEIKEVSHEF